MASPRRPAKPSRPPKPAARILATRLPLLGIAAVVAVLAVAAATVVALSLRHNADPATSEPWRVSALAAESALAAGQLAKALDDVQTAIESAEAVLLAGSTDAVVREATASLHMLKGRVLEALPPTRCAGGTCTEHAANAYRKALQIAPSDRAEAALASVSKVLNGASPAYVSALFDEYADTFDAQLLQKLEYQAPALLGRAVHDALLVRGVSLPVARLLDAGCGTGLAGIELRSLAAHMTGVDLSAGMIARARQREGLYDTLIQSELVQHLGAVEEGMRYNLIASADMLNYLADLRELLVAVAAALFPGGLLAFTLEGALLKQLHQRDSEWRWLALPSGRYAHNAEWVVAEATRHGLDIVEQKAIPKLRLDGGTAVPGMLLVFAKSGLSGSGVVK